MGIEEMKALTIVPSPAGPTAFGSLQVRLLVI